MLASRRPACMDRVAVDATHVMSCVRAGEPVADVVRLRMAPQTGAVGLFGLQLREFVDAFMLLAGQVEAAGPVAVFAFQRLLRVIAEAERPRLLLVTGAALVGTDALCPGD